MVTDESTREAFSLALGHVDPHDVVEFQVDGSKLLAHVAVDVDEHHRRLGAGCAAITSTRSLHALWELPDGIPVSESALSDTNANTIKTFPYGLVRRSGRTFLREYQPVVTVLAVAVVAVAVDIAIRRVRTQPTIFRRVAICDVVKDARIVDSAEAVKSARLNGIGVVTTSTSGRCSEVLVEPAAGVLGVPAVYRWWVGELAYHEWSQAQSAHSLS